MDLLSKLESMFGYHVHDPDVTKGLRNYQNYRVFLIATKTAAFDMEQKRCILGSVQADLLCSLLLAERQSKNSQKYSIA